MINTKSYSYNNAIKESQQYSEMLSVEELKKWLEADIQCDTGTIHFNDTWWKMEESIVGNKRMQEAQQAYDDVVATGAFPYNSIVAEKMLDNLSIEKKNGEDGDSTVRRAECVVYNTNCYRRAMATLASFVKMIQEGYTPISDIIDDCDGKKAVITGKVETIIGNVPKNNQKVKLVCKDGKHGYQTPHMRSKYFICLDDMFYKLI